MDSFYSAWLIMLFPLSFAYLILSKKLYDIDIVLRRILFTGLIAFIPSAVIVILHAILFQTNAEPKRLLLLFFVTLLLISVVLYSLEYVTTKLERVMFPRKFALQSALKKISSKLGSISDFNELKGIVLIDIINTLQIYGGAIVFKYHDKLEVIHEGHIDSILVERLTETGNCDHPDYSCFEIGKHEEYISYLIITGKKTNTYLSIEEIQWLKLITSYLAVSLENLYLIRKLMVNLEELAALIPGEQATEDFVWFRRTMFALQEKERYRIAMDLHDSTMQDIFFVKQKVYDLAKKHEPGSEAHKIIKGILTHLELMNESLRESCFELNPYLMDRIGLVKTIEKLVEKENGLHDFDIIFFSHKIETIERIHMEAKRHLFRIVQELIANAKKHSLASHVKIRLLTERNTLSVLYWDNGVGFDPAATPERDIVIGPTPETHQSGWGLTQIKSRALHLNGKLEVDSNPGEGVKLNIMIPLKSIL